MPKEIERKFLINRQILNPATLASFNNSAIIKQGYIPTEGKTVVRVRLKGEKAYLTLKGANTGITRTEFEYPIPVEDAEHMIQELCTGPTVEKTRYTIHIGQHDWEVDIFHGDNEGLAVAEIELSHEQETFSAPEWLGKEVSDEPRYYNSSLIEHPFNTWPEA